MRSITSLISCTPGTPAAWALAAACGWALLAPATQAAVATESAPAGPTSMAATTAAVHAAPEQNLRLSYYTRSIGDDGVQRETRYTNRMYRHIGMVWTEREMPAALTDSPSSTPSNAAAHRADQAHDEAQAAPLRVSRNAEGQERVELILDKTRRVIEVGPAHYGSVGYAGSWDSAYWLVSPATLQKMPRVGSAKAGVQRYRSVQGGRTVTVDWDVAGQFPRNIERSDARGTDLTQVSVTPIPAPKVLPWKASESFSRGDYSDLLD